jgi:hypothetical protein
MKNLLRSGFISLVTGLLFVLGLGLGLAIIDRIPERPKAPPHSVATSIKLAPVDLVIVDHERVLDSPEFLVRGTLVNRGPGTWYAPAIYATVLAGGAKMNTCSVHTDVWLTPGDKYRFAILCMGTAGGDLPENVTYEIVVKSAHGP